MTTFEPEPPQEPLAPLEEPGEPEPTPEPEPEPEEPQEPQEEPQEPPAEPETQARMEEIGKQLDKLSKHVAKRIGEILGDDAHYFDPCEICTFSNTPGWRPSGPLPPDVVSAVYTALGQQSPAEYRNDPHSEVCSECNGNGQVATGSKVTGQDRLPCIPCESRGWVATDDERKPKHGTVANGPTPLYPPPSFEASALPALDEPDPPEVAALKAQGYTVIRPFVPTGQRAVAVTIDTVYLIVIAVCSVIVAVHLTQVAGVIFTVVATVLVLVVAVVVAER